MMSCMGLATDLGYSHTSANPLQRLVRWLRRNARRRRRVLRSLRHLDDLVGRLSKGRHSAPGLLAGLAVLDVTTTGRKSGQPRTSHLIATPYDTTLALLGTNFGQESTPAWVLNLEADPRATVTYRNVAAPWWPARQRRRRPRRSSPSPASSTPATATIGREWQRPGASARSC